MFALQLLKAVLKALNDIFIDLQDLGQHGLLVLCVGDAHVWLLEDSINFHRRLSGNQINKTFACRIFSCVVDALNRASRPDFYIRAREVSILR